MVSRARARAAAKIAARTLIFDDKDHQKKNIRFSSFPEYVSLCVILQAAVIGDIRPFLIKALTNHPNTSTIAIDNATISTISEPILRFGSVFFFSFVRFYNLSLDKSVFVFMQKRSLIERPVDIRNLELSTLER
jgi:hypothetical protein